MDWRKRQSELKWSFATRKTIALVENWKIEHINFQVKDQYQVVDIVALNLFPPPQLWPGTLQNNCLFLHPGLQFYRFLSKYLVEHRYPSLLLGNKLNFIVKIFKSKVAKILISSWQILMFLILFKIPAPIFFKIPTKISHVGGEVNLQ